MIKAYFKTLNIKYKLNYIDKSNPLGTAGALKYLEKEIKQPFFVSNCDIIIKENYSDILDFHENSNFYLTMVCSMQHHKIPYGVCKVNESAELIEIREKPEFDLLVNAGMYVISPVVLKYIPENKFYNITDLISQLMKNRKKIGVYPVSEKSYIDVGQWKEYEKAVNIFNTQLVK